jgi:hypothetical protein
MLNLFVVLGLALIALAACNKSSPPPQKPVTPRTVAQIEMSVRLPPP